ncbi:MAG: alpha/beta hydrolase family protein [Chitinivibrionales bacterium]|nr:alpha/beta hydrolase family protein [Chitinivibrionales bacterium]
MALIDCKFFSETLGLSSSITVILPQNTEGQIGMKGALKKGKHKTLYLLHGLSDDHSIWLRRTSIERYVAPLGIAVVMPAVNRSFYADMACGEAYETFIARELPGIVRSFFNLSGKREDNFVAGLSMGGYGAFKLALKYPENYCAAASLSGVLDVAGWAREKKEMVFSRLFTNAFGTGPLKGTKNDLFYLAKKLRARGTKMPRLYACCGDKDELYVQNVKFRDFARKNDIDLSWRSDSGYGHTWDYWDLRIQTVLDWMFPLSQGS